MSGRLSTTACNQSVTIRISNSAAKTIQTNATPGNLTAAINSGFEIDWDAENSRCELCQWSGGLCGSHNVTKEVTCYCKDRPYLYVCGSNNFRSSSDCATCPTAIVLKNCIKTPHFFFFSTEVLPKPPKETVHPSLHRPPPCQTRLSAVTRRRQRTSAGCCCREPPPVAGEIVAGRFHHRNGFSPTVPSSDVRSPCHRHPWIRLGSSFVFRPLSASNSAPIVSIYAGRKHMANVNYTYPTQID
ncbi:Wall-associated receptor kinase, C-terminal [Parasponia andersonii]|uniref:Wall-associated receptor kinase, C-terminal n=1 Tax=Parasponia andersonii TaxID=3476 RepID=A0A2P5BWE1_PARAD|nr:Wall-associated receptor kinase, C-terminal [Parasponia andersonii]